MQRGRTRLGGQKGDFLAGRGKDVSGMLVSAGWAVRDFQTGCSRNEWAVPCSLTCCLTPAAGVSLAPFLPWTPEVGCEMVNTRVLAEG